MRAPEITLEAGGAPSGEQALAIIAAASAVLDDARTRVAADPLPAAYRSPWRAAALRDGLREPLGPAGR